MTSAQQAWSLRDIPVGSRIVITGGPGSGKSWLARALIARFQHESEAVMVVSATECGRLFYSNFMPDDCIEEDNNIGRDQITSFMSCSSLSSSRLLIFDNCDESVPFEPQRLEHLRHSSNVTSIYTFRTYANAQRLYRSRLRDSLTGIATHLFVATHYGWAVSDGSRIIHGFTLSPEECDPGFIDIGGRRAAVEDAKRKLLNELVSVPAGRFKGLLPDGGVEYQRQLARLGEITRPAV